MKKIMSLMILTTMFFVSFSQNTNLEYRFTLKAYNTFVYQTNENTNFHPFGKYESQDYLNPSVAIQLKTKKNNFHELEISKIQVNKQKYTTGNTWGYNTISSSIAIRYEYGINFNKNKDSKIVPAISLGISPYLNFVKEIPVISSSFEHSETTFGAKAFIIPRFVYHFNKRIALDCNVPLCFVDISNTVYNNQNPAMPKDERTSTRSDFTILPYYFSFRLGIAYKI